MGQRGSGGGGRGLGENRNHTRTLGCPTAPLPRLGRVWAVGLPLFLSACSHKPPPDFAPDPGLVARIDSIRMIVPAAACPGTTIPASYEAVLDDGSLVPFANR